MSKEWVWDIAWGVGIIGLALVATLLRKHGYMDAETVNRVVMGAIGLMIAWFGNRMPKRIVPNRWALQATRLAGWSMALSGLVYAGLWAFAPPRLAVAGGSAAILSGIAVTFWYCLSLRKKAKTA